MKKTLWLRSETKLHERRTPLVPEHAAELVRSKHKVVVERCENRIFCDDEYENAGCKMVDAGTWPDAPKSAYIIGIKELPVSDKPLIHKHIYFAHAYKGQEGAAQLLARFKTGKGLLYDLEFLTNNKGNRVTTFSYWAGVSGCAITLLIWLQKCKNSNAKIKIPEFYPNESEVIEIIKQQLNDKNSPSSLVIGARGRCGRGVIAFLKKVGLNATSLYRKDTKDRQEYPEIFKHNLLFNCIYLTTQIVPFITKEQLEGKRKLSVIADISCDPNGPHNPLPIYKKITSFKTPTRRICAEPQSLDIMAIDHLPSFLPRESSCDFSGQLLPYLHQLLKNEPQSATWENAATIFANHV